MERGSDINCSNYTTTNCGKSHLIVTVINFCVSNFGVFGLHITNSSTLKLKNHTTDYLHRQHPQPHQFPTRSGASNLTYHGFLDESESAN